MKIAIVGCGDIGVRAARLLLDKGHRVVGIRRNVAKLPSWLEATSADVSQRESLDFLSSEPFDIVLYSLAASGFSESAYRSAYVTGVANTLDALADQMSALKRFVFVSSTSVYHQNDGSEVDEESSTKPTGFNGRIVLEGERLAAATAKGSVIRFSGIYGPDRTRMIDRVEKNIRTDPQDRSYTNRIHVDDCAGVLAHIVDLTSQGTVEANYLASDSMPCTRVELETFLAAELGVTDTRSGEPPLPAASGVAKRIAGSKRCSNRRLLQSGYRFLYPDFRSGYRQVLAARARFGDQVQQG